MYLKPVGLHSAGVEIAVKGLPVSQSLGRAASC